MTTARDIVTTALLEIGVTDPIEPVAAEIAQFGLNTLNSTLDRMNLSRGSVYTYVRHVFPLVAGTDTYTFGAGGTFNAANSGRIRRAGLVRTDTDTEVDLQMVDYRGYSDIADRDSRGTPLYLYDSRTEPLNNIVLWPVPDSATYSLTLYTDSEIPNLTNLDSVIVCSGAYKELIMTELAIALSGPLRAQVPQSTVSRNTKAWAAVLADNTMRLDGDMSVHYENTGRISDITTGRLI